MKKFLKIAYPIIVLLIVVVVILATGYFRKEEDVKSNSNSIDFTYAVGSMISKEGMSDEEMKMHDAKIIQYALYNIKNVLEEDPWSGTKKQLYSWYEIVEDNSFLPRKERPFNWLDSSLLYFERIGSMKCELLDEDDCFGLEVPDDGGSYYAPFVPGTKRIDNSPTGMLWRSLRSNMDSMIAAVDNFVGMSYEERARSVENHEKIKKLLDELNDDTVKVVYRNPDNQYEYIFGYSPEPTRETIIFAADITQKLLDLAPLGDISTNTLTELYINEMPQYFATMLEDYDGTRYNPTYKSMNDWYAKFGRMSNNWFTYYDLVLKLKTIYDDSFENIES